MLPFIIATDLPIEAGSQLQSDLPLESQLQKAPVFFEELETKDIQLEKEFPIDALPQQVPLSLDGSVDNFDPIARAKFISKSLPRKLCGTYMSFDNDSSHDVILSFLKIRPTGQMINLKGNMQIGQYFFPVQGNLNAKSEQFELLPLTNVALSILGSSGSFSGLQGVNLLAWNPSSFTNKGGRLSLSKTCNLKQSKAPLIISIWR